MRLETADRRMSEIDTRRAESEAELAAASLIPDKLAVKRADLMVAIEKAEARRAAAADALSVGEAALREAVHRRRDGDDAQAIAGEPRNRRLQHGLIGRDRE